MTITRMRWLAALGMSLGLAGILSAQHPGVWRSAPATSSAPLATIGRPIVIATTATTPAPVIEPARVRTVEVPLPASHRPAAIARTGPIAIPARLGKPRPVYRAQAPDNLPPPEQPSSRLPPPPSADPLLGEMTPAIAGTEPGVTTPLGGGEIPGPDPASVAPAGTGLAPPAATHTVSGPPDAVPPPPVAPFSPPDVTPGVDPTRPIAPGFWEKTRDLFTFGERGSTNGRCCFQSDNCFQGMPSPLTTPFYFEDPRSLTEVRPIFMYQSMPNNSVFGGGDLFWFGTQLRLAFTERLSVVIHELGALSINPDGPVAPLYDGGTGFSELKISPKYTFYRCPETHTVAAAGLLFEIPTGASKVFQDTGTLSLAPYLSFGQTFGPLPSGFGSLNFLGNTGYSFSVDNKRSEFYYLNLHLDYNIANLNTFFPLIEMTWMHYTRAGTSNNIGSEGADLINFGSTTRRGKDYLSLAAGLRYRFSENIWAGTAIQFPVTRENGLSDYRLTFDVIFRY